MEVGQALGKNRIARAWAIFSLAKTRESDRRGWKTGTGDDHAIGKDFEHDLSTRVLVLPMGDRVDQRFTQRLGGIFIEAHSVEANDFHRVPSVSVDERYGAIDGERHRTAYILVIAWIAVRFGAAV